MFGLQKWQPDLRHIGSCRGLFAAFAKTEALPRLVQRFPSLRLAIGVTVQTMPEKHLSPQKRTFGCTPRAERVGCSPNLMTPARLPIVATRYNRPPPPPDLLRVAPAILALNFACLATYLKRHWDEETGLDAVAPSVQVARTRGWHKDLVVD